jgi:hypothetical protein
MAGVSPQQSFEVDKLPANLKQTVVDKLIKRESSRAVSAYLLQRGHKVSHNAVARYNRIVIQPALETGAKLQKLEQPDSSTIEQISATRDLTRAALAAEPILARLDWAWQEATAGVEESKTQVVEKDGVKQLVPGDLKARAALLNTARGLIETEAKARMHPGFAPTQQLASGTTIQIAIITAPGETPKIEADSVIDVQVVDIERG